MQNPTMRRLNNVKDALEQARGAAQDLHKKIDESTGKSQAELRADLQNVAAQARELGNSLKAIAEGQKADAKQHVEHAASSFEDAAKHAETAASATGGDIKRAAQATLSRTRDAAESLSEAVAAKRSTAKA